jgi:L-2-hydroxyglutarate oxidase LhgO
LLASNVGKDNYKTWGKPGIRAQLIDIKTQKLEMDFVVEGDDRSMHILNAVSPAFTCSIPFSRYVCEKIKTRLN